MHSRSYNVKFMSYNDVNKIVHGLFDSLRSRDQGNLETSMRESDFIFDSVEMYYKGHKVNFRHDGSSIDYPDWIKKKKVTINLKKKDDKCFQYLVTVALNYEKIKWNPKGINYP